MRAFNFNRFHSKWGQPIMYLKKMNEDIENNVFEEESNTGNFIVQSISGHSLLMNYNITAEKGLSLFSSVELSVNDVIIYNNLHYTIIDAVEEYPMGHGKEYRYTAYYSGDKHGV